MYSPIKIIYSVCTFILIEWKYLYADKNIKQ